jgi:hypothetical protein
MRLAADGRTRVRRLVPASVLHTDTGYDFCPATPMFLAAGDRFTLEDGHVVVLRSHGGATAVAGAWATRCRGR